MPSPRGRGGIGVADGAPSQVALHRSRRRALALCLLQRPPSPSVLSCAHLDKAVGNIKVILSEGAVAAPSPSLKVALVSLIVSKGAQHRRRQVFVLWPVSATGAGVLCIFVEALGRGLYNFTGRVEEHSSFTSTPSRDAISAWTPHIRLIQRFSNPASARRAASLSAASVAASELSGKTSISSDIRGSVAFSGVEPAT